MQRSTGRRQVRFNIMGLRCADTCHLPQAEQQGVDGRGILNEPASQDHGAQQQVVGCAQMSCGVKTLQTSSLACCEQRVCLQVLPPQQP